MQLTDFVNLGWYPVNQLDSERGQQLIQECQRMMVTDTICVLPGFLRQQAVDRMVAEVNDLEQASRQIDFLTTLYSWKNNDGFAEDHPRSTLLPRRCGVITTEQLAPDGHCRILFQFDELTEFVRRLLDYDTLYRSACPNISVRLNVMDENDEFGWHFDTNDGVVSFILQNADQGGQFEYAPLIRSEEDENYGGVRAILNGEEAPKIAHTPPGTFTLFLGRRSLHQVSRVGDTQKSRQSLLFSYDRKPDMVFPEQTRKRMTEPSSAPFRGAAAKPE